MNTAIGQSAGVFDASIDGASTAVDSFTPSGDGDCATTWSATNLQDQLHTVIVTFKGASAQAATSQGAGQAQFELTNFMYVFSLFFVSRIC